MKTLNCPSPFPLIPSPCQAVVSTTFVDSSTFAPTTGLLAWYRADATDVADGDEVIAWPDSSGMGNHLHSAGPSVPLQDNSGAFPVVAWLGIEANYLETTAALWTAGQDRTVAIVYQSDDQLATYGICGQGDGGLGAGRGFWLVNGVSDPLLTTGGAAVGPGTAFSTAFKWAMAHYKNSTTTLTCEDASGAGNSVQTVEDIGSPFNVGDIDGSFPTNTFKGSIAEILVYDHKLTTEEQAALVTYLEEKFSL